MRMIAVDDERRALNSFIKVLRETEPDADVTPFTEADAAFAFLADNKVDVAFLDIELNGYSGLVLAEKCKSLCPQVNIIFVTGYSNYTMEALRLHASGYLMKPVRAEELRVELNNLRHPVSIKTEPLIRVQTFGSFEVFVGEKPLKFRYTKTKELFAYLIDRKGASANTGELCGILWEDREDTPAMRSQLRNLISDLMKTLSNIQSEDIIIKTRNSFAVDTEKIDCDFYHLLNHNEAAFSQYMGQYMTQYSWAEITLGYLEKRIEMKM
ncbi:response regulator [uncultured Robinsoniella sp.]|uniref:response regulator n=1 Tax=uncultured Robinsoniella sp. TaxID=904190 RepID=UPI00374F9F81